MSCKSDILGQVKFIAQIFGVATEVIPAPLELS